jgi:serine/threonine protein kinase
LSQPERADFADAADLLGGRWEVHAVLSGAMGTVLLLADPATGGRFAAKTPGVGGAVNADALRRFQTEARTWMSLGHHENVVEAFFLEEIPWRGRVRPFLFLEFVDGVTLDVLIKSEGRIALPAALDVATGMAWGMAHAHGEGREGPRIVHRDLKPENVFLTKHRVVKVSDFGIARALDRPDESAAEGRGLGTPYYAAPEQMKDARAADVRSDVYSYGAVLFHLLTGEPPFPARDLSALVWKVLREDPRTPSSVVPGIPADLDRLVL